MRRAVAFVFVVACDAPVAPAPASIQPALALGDACQNDIPDCEAACALREVHRLDHIDWFDRRCAAVVLGKNPDKAVGYVPPAIDVVDASAPTVQVSCEPPYSLGPDGIKTWKRECFR